jgi:hypothetical protein
MTQREARDESVRKWRTPQNLMRLLIGHHEDVTPLAAFKFAFHHFEYLIAYQDLHRPTRLKKRIDTIRTLSS